MNTFFILVWVGGIAAAYQMFRDSGSGRLDAALSAVVWPAAVGEYLVRNFMEVRGRNEHRH
jgi:hypothetical protein